MRLNLGAGGYPIDGFDNRDAGYEDAWFWQNGLPDIADSSVEGITVSHSLMYVGVNDWPFVFSELHRVLEPRGVIRVTEDNTTDRASERFGGHHDAVTLTDAATVLFYLHGAGFTSAIEVAPGRTLFKDRSLMQSWHGAPPKVFYVEGVK